MHDRTKYSGPRSPSTSAFFPVVVAVASLGCDPRTESPDEFRAQELSVGLVVGLPEHANLRSTEDTVTVTLDPNTRTPLMFSIRRQRPTTSHRNVRRQRLSDDVTVEYVVTSSAGGSGGTEATINGVLRVGDTRFALRCHHQAEAPGSPMPEQCFTYLATARLSSTQ